MPDSYSIHNEFKREYMCITTVGMTPADANGTFNEEVMTWPEDLALDACWGEFVNQSSEHNVVYRGNDTACIFNLPTDLRIAMLQRMIDVFTYNPINCHVQFAYDDTTSNFVGISLTSILLFSMFCLLLTVLVYALKEELFTIPGLNLMCLCMSHFVHYLTGILNLFNIPHHQVTHNVCTFFGFLRNFSILSTFFWLNVMAFDVWQTVSSMEVSHSRGSKRHFNWKRYLKYSLYAWGMALFIAVWAVLFDSIPGIPDFWRPSYRRPYLLDPDVRCAMSGNNLGSLLLFNTLPRLLMFLFNCLFFFLTARTIHQANSETAAMRTNNSPRNMFSLYIKLFVVMGLAWSLNIVDYIIHSYYGIDWVWSGPKWFTILADYFTALIGVAIYLTFGLMPTISLIRKKCCCMTAVELPQRFSTNKTSNGIRLSGAVLNGKKALQSTRDSSEFTYHSNYSSAP